MIKNKLHIFGDSFSLGDGCLPGDEYWTHTNGNGTVWAKLLSDELGLDLQMYAERGASNQEILRILTQNLYKINKDDIVIIGLTDYFRYEVKYDLKYYRVLMETFSNLDDVKNLKYQDDEDVSKEWIHALEEYMKYIHLPNNMLYITEVASSIKSIYKFLKKNSIKTLLWTWDGLYSDVSVNLIKTKNEYTIKYAYPEINDMHYSWYGHSEIYKIMLNKLKKY